MRNLVSYTIRRLDPQTDGTRFYAVEVEPKFKAFASGGTVYLDGEELEAFERWRDGEGLIQQMLPSLSEDARELLLSGMSPEEWKRHCGHPDPHERK